MIDRADKVIHGSSEALGKWHAIESSLGKFHFSLVKSLGHSSFTSHSSYAIVQYKNSVNSCKTMLNNNFTGCEIMHDCMALIPMHCPFNLL